MLNICLENMDQLSKSVVNAKGIERLEPDEGIERLETDDPRAS